MPLPVASVSKTTWNKDVYEPSDDTFLLTDALQQLADETWAEQPPQTVVEIGCGSGYVICSAALMLAHMHVAPRQLIAVDHSPAALAATQQTLDAHQVGGHVQLLQGDLCAPFHDNLRGHVDLLLFNPPYVPTPDHEWAGASNTVTSAWAGGHAGRRVIDRLLPLVPELLSHTGQMLMITVTENDPQGIIESMKAHGLEGSMMMTRAADEECLAVVRFGRRQHVKQDI